jgi:hypothetical protein
VLFNVAAPEAVNAPIVASPVNDDVPVTESEESVANPAGEAKVEPSVTAPWSEDVLVAVKVDVVRVVELIVTPVIVVTRSVAIAPKVPANAAVIAVIVLRGYGDVSVVRLLI